MKRGWERALACLLALVMVIGVLPVGVLAEEASEFDFGSFFGGSAVTEEVSAATTYASTDTDYLMFATDRHTNTSIIATMINNMESKIGEDKLEYLGLGGDMVGSGSNHPAYNSSTVLDEATGATSSLSDANVDIVAGIHDMNVNDDAGIVLSYNYDSDNQGGGAQIYEGDKYYVYGVPEGCISGDVSGVDPETEANDFVTWANGSTIDKSKVIFVLSHYPLHQRRNDNDGAVYWAQALNTVAVGDDSTIDRDVAFFWGHNHTGESSADTEVYHVAPGNSISVQGGSSSQTIYFTYANAGYLNAKSSATLVEITDTEIKFNKYTNSSYSTNGVTRVVTEPAVTSIAISGTTEYTVGDELALTVTATYSDGSTADVTADATLSGYDMSTAGTYTVTATYGELTATASITVTDPYVTKIAVTTQPTKLTYVTGEELDTTGMVVTATYNNGTTAEVTGWYTSTVDMTTTGEKTVTVNYVADNLTFQTTFTITVEEGVAEGVTLTSIEITAEPTKKEYLVSEELSLDGMVVVATFSDGSTEELAYKPFSTSTVYGGYELDNFSMYVKKSHEVKVTYTFGEVTCTDTFTINVWNEDFKDETTGVTVHVTGDYGVTAVSVSESENEYVATAISEVISGTNYKAYDISLTFDEGYEETTDTKTVTLPIPEGVTNPAVYYVSDDGETVTNMGATKTEDGTAVTFTTTHFSTYVVGESTEITVPDPTTATVTGATTTTKKTVYVLTSSISSGNEYLIVNGNAAGSYYALANNSGSVAATGVTVKTDSEIGTYIELDDATDELWTTSGSSSTSLKNGSYYLGYTTSENRYTLGLSTTSRTWSYSSGNNRLSLSVDNDRNSTTYYLRYNDGWTWTNSNSASGRSVYFYVPTEIDVTTSADGTYSIAGNPAEVTKVVVEGTTVTLGSTLTFAPESGEATTTDTSTTATYTVVDGGDPNGIISGISGNTVTFSGKYGKALVEVSYTGTAGDQTYTVVNYILIEAQERHYDIEISEDGENASAEILVVRGVTAETTKELSYILTYEGPDGSETLTPTIGITWSILSDESDAGIASIDQNGKLTFTGNEGTIKVAVKYQVDDNTMVEDIITIRTRKDNAVTPDESTTDFPRWPNEGAVRFDKTATAVGNFSETGIAQVELSMAGIPFRTGGDVDVVIMLDMTGSMSDDAMAAAEESAIAFAEQIVKNDDGTYNNSRIAVLAFNSSSSSPFTYWELGTITADQWDNFCTAVRGASANQTSGGTPYDEALEKCQSILAAAKTDGTGNDRQQFCVFVSDGGPTSYTYITNYDAVKAGTATEYTTSSASATGGSNQSDSNFATIATYTHEYYSTLMKDDGVTMYSVLTGLVAANYPNCTTIMQNIASDSSKAYVVEDGTDTSAITGAFTAIAEEINAAATNVQVEDVITDEYEMIFELPNSNIEGLPSGQEFYIEVVDYPLDETTHERTGESTIKQRIYLATNTDGNVYISKITYTDESGNVVEQAITPVYTAKAKDTDKAYFDENGTYYPDGNGTHHMTSGAYVVLNDDGSLKSLHTVYFTYVVASKQLNWTVTSMSQTSETALRYFVYLKNSGGVDSDKQVEAGTYPTNEYATLTYTNYLGNECEQEFPVPQMTWNGAQVSYVFYLVNDDGKPVNRAGREVTFAEAIFVTDIYTYAITWNDLEQSAGLEASYLAQNLLPSDYSLYDANASYKIHVYEDEKGVNLNNHFIIGGTSGDTTTYVYNNKTDVDKYNVHGTYAAAGTYLCKSYSVTATIDADGNISAASHTGGNGETQVAWDNLASTTGATNINGYAYYIDENGEVYTIVQKTDATAINGFDFANTTVAFAVVWEKKLVPDTVVVDFGLPVDIDVVSNDFVYNYVTGIGATDPNYGINVGYEPDTARLTAQKLTIDGHSVEIQDQNHIRFTPGSGKSMEFSEPVKFYYETTVEAYEDSKVVEGYMYSSVTVIPATTVYYEESFVTFTNSSGVVDATDIAEDAAPGDWATDGTTMSATQDQDRPGESQISADLDADNNYGYDSAYTNCTTYSLGSAKKVTVDAATGSKSKAPTAKFTFTGTGFDVISLTDSDSGVITVTATNANDADDVTVMSVDNYYGYEYYEYYKTVYTWTAVTVENEDGTTETVNQWVGVNTEIEREDVKDDDSVPENPELGVTYTVYGERLWVATPSATDCIWQVPVIKFENLDYGTYDVEIKVNYLNSLNHVGDDAYSFWLDAIRVYNPTQDTTAKDAYAKDDELNPSYKTIRDLLVVDMAALDSGDATGVVFIDGIDAVDDVSVYANPGPNNETYLAAEQAVAFKLTSSSDLTDVASLQIGAKLAFGSEAVLNKGTVAFPTLKTATDMYYDLPVTWTWNDTTQKYETETIVLSNGSTNGAVISLTNLKLVGAAWGTGVAALAALDETETELPEVNVVSTTEVVNTASYTLRTLYSPASVEEEEPEVEEEVTPEAPEIDPFVPASISAKWVAGRAGGTSTLTITTSEDVEAVAVNQEAVGSYIRVPSIKFEGFRLKISYSRLWIYTVKIAEAGTYSYNIVAYDETGLASEPIVSQLTVKAR